MTIRALIAGAMLAVTGLADAASVASAASTTASFVVVHGIPGRDVAATLDPLLPVDVLVAGKYCLLHGLSFGQIAGPFDVPAGTYTVAISLADPITPCSQKPVISASLTLAAGSFSSVVAALSTTGTPTADAFPVDVTAIGPGFQRFITADAADAPKLNVVAVSDQSVGEALKVTLSSGQENESFDFARPQFAVTAQLATGGPVAGPVTVTVPDRSVVLLYTVGSSKSGSLTVLSKIIPDVF